MDKDEFVAFIKYKAEQSVNATGSVPRTVYVPQGDGLIGIPLSPLSREKTVSLLQMLREKCPFVAMVLDRNDLALITVLDGQTTAIYAADIIHSADRPCLGPWRTMHMTEAQGRLGDPAPEWN